MAEKRNMAAGAAALAAVFIAGKEGVELVAYRDPVGIVTICAGETKGVKIGDRATPEECDSRLRQRLAEDFWPKIVACVPSLADLPARPQVAHLSLAYNIGTGAYCRSSVARLQNSGQRLAACDMFMKWNRAGGIEFRGLTNRRAAERELCRAV